MLKEKEREKRPMKKMMAILIAVMMLMGMMACGNTASPDSVNEIVSASEPTEEPTPEPTEEPTPEPTEEPVIYVPVEPGKTYTIDGECSIVLNKITFRPYVNASHSYYALSSGDKSKRALAFCFNITNLSSINIDDVYLKEHFSFLEDSLSVGVTMDTEDGKSLDSKGFIKPNETRVVYIYSFTSPIDTGTLCLDYENAHYQALYSASSFKDDTITLQAGKKNVVKDYGEITFNKIYTTEELIPKNPGKYYTYWQPKSANETLFVAEFTVKNLDKQEIHPMFLFGNSEKCSITLDGYTYTADCKISASNDSEITGIVNLNPLQETTVYVMASIPQSLANASGSIDILFFGQHFTVKVR